MIKNLTDKQHIGEFIRFGVVGLTATAIHYGVYYLLLFYTNHNVAYTVGFLVSFLCNFLFSCVFTFRVKMSVRRMINFGISHGLGYVVGIALLNIFIWIGLDENWSFFAASALSVPINFLLVRFALKSRLAE